MKKILLALLLVLPCMYSQAQDVKANYEKAFDELHQMLKGEITPSFKRAVFVTENAYVDNLLSYEDFCFQIDALVKLTRSVEAMDGLKYDQSDRKQVLLAGAIFKVIRDSLKFSSTDNKISFIKVPFTYDKDDFWGGADWTKMFVTKLLYEQTGNCHSLPALYKIIADEIGVKTWLAIAPNHTYIKQWNDKTGWYNTELTTGSFPTDAELKYNSYIKNEAIISGVYMDTLSTKEIISYAITDLAQGYLRKLDYKDTTTPLQWLETALTYYPDYPNAMIMRAELMKKEYERLMENKHVGRFSELWNDKDSKDKFEKLEQAYTQVHEIGYRRMPKQMYLNWLYRIRQDTTRKPYKFASPQPFAQYNYQVKMMTAGEGDNYEFFDQENTVRIGTVELDRRNNKIVRFIKPEGDDMPDEIISRMYDPAVGRFWEVDPKSEKRNWVNPYNFVQNNPINRVDPSGLTDYALNRTTGQITQVGDKNNDPDRILRTDKKGNVMKKGEGFLGFLVSKAHRGEAKVAIAGIEKGILSNGANFMNNHNTIAVGGKGQPTLQGVRDFALKLSNYVDKEMGGFYLSNKGESSTSFVHFSPYKDNDAQNAHSTLRLDLSRPDLLGNVNPTHDWHTHLSRFGDSDRMQPSSIGPSGGDEGYKSRQSVHNPSLRFIIITNRPNESNASEIPY
ncbi:MAG: hypothetical protein JSS79_05535 [Bacteroidetes bacterium]|nr:hypothetical protein [Bacteroidota bacterium]